MKRETSFPGGWSCALAAVALIALVAGQAGAQEAEPWVMFGHDIRSSTIVTIDTHNGLARIVGDVGFAATSGSALEACRAPVPVQGGMVYPEGTIFGILRDTTFNKDYVVVVDNETGETTKIVELDLAVSGRGIAFGPDGKTLYVYTPRGELRTIDPVTGENALIGAVRDGEGRQLSGVSLQWDPVSQEFLGLADPSWSVLIRIDPQDASATVIEQLEGMNVCTLTRAPGPVEGPGASVFPEGTWFLINNNSNMVSALSIDTVGGVVEEIEEVGTLGPNAERVCGSAFALPDTPWASPTHPGYPGPEPSATEGAPTPSATLSGYPTGSATPATSKTPTKTRTPSMTPSATRTNTPRPTRTPLPGPTYPPGGPQCVCPVVLHKVPPVVIQDALANPERYYGWRYPLDLGKPASPGNPLRECLTLPYLTFEYHPIWNKPLWRVGCQ